MHASICPAVIKVEMAAVPFCGSYEIILEWFYVLSNVILSQH